MGGGGGGGGGRGGGHKRLIANYPSSCLAAAVAPGAIITAGDQS